MTSNLSRRSFITTAVTAAGGFALGIGIGESAEAATLSVRPWGDEAARYPGEINAWVVIDPDDSVIIRYGRAEMGQGSFTALPQILTEELECDWAFVKPEYASANRNLRDNKVYGSLSTGGSRAVRETGTMVQQAGASARERLIAAAARRWNVPASDCAAAMSKITHKPTGRTLRYGELAVEAAAIALDMLPIEWEVGASGATDSAQFRKAYLDALDETGAVARHDGDVDAAMATAGRVIEATYDVPIIAHAPMEPLNAIAHVQADRVDVWVGTQNADLALTLAAQMSGVKPENVHIHNTFSGGGFGRRLRPDEVAQAVAVSRAVGKPVKLIWTREEEIRHGRYRTQAAIRFKAGIATGGTPIALDIRNSAGSSNPQALRNGLDPQTTQGLVNTAYKLPGYRVVSILKNTQVPLGPWRAPGHSQNVFFMESFIDEMAHAVGKDPVTLRRELLAHRPDFQQVLDLLVEKGDWGKPMPRGKGRGVAIHESYDSIVGMTAEVAVTDGEVKVERVVIVCDCGVVVNPRGVETQLEGGMIYGLSAARFGEITVKNGRVEQGNFDTYPVVRFKDAPKTEVYISPTPGKRWGGVGEPGATMIQPAITNAIFAATGKRLRSLPIRGQDLSGGA